MGSVTPKTEITELREKIFVAVHEFCGPGSERVSIIGAVDELCLLASRFARQRNGYRNLINDILNEVRGLEIDKDDLTIWGLLKGLEYRASAIAKEE